MLYKRLLRINIELAFQVEKLEMQLTDLQTKRSAEFAKVRSRIAGAVSRELGKHCEIHFLNAELLYCLRL